MEIVNSVSLLRRLFSEVLRPGMSFSNHDLIVKISPRVDWRGVLINPSNYFEVGFTFDHPVIDFFETRRIKRLFGEFASQYPSLTPRVSYEKVWNPGGTKRVVVWLSFFTQDDIDMNMLAFIPHSRIEILQSYQYPEWCGAAEMIRRAKSAYA